MHHHNVRYAVRLTTLVGLGCFLLLTACGSLPPTAADPHAREETESQSIGTFAASVGSTAAPVLGITVDAHGTVLGVETESAAQHAGIQVGDRLIEIDGTPLGPALAATARESTFVYEQEIQTLRSRIGEGKLLKVVLSRGGRPMTLDVQPGARSVREGQATSTPVPQNELYM